MDHHGETWVRNNPKIHVVFVLDRHSLYVLFALIFNIQVCSYAKFKQPFKPLQSHDSITKQS